jgi:hypothetical protein
MKRIAKRTGSRGRLRLGLLLATAAAFLLVPVAAAYAAEDTTIVGAGEGSGWVKGATGFNEGGEPYIECHWNGVEWDVGTSVAEGSAVPGLNNCGTEALEPIPGLPGVEVKQTFDAGSEPGGLVALKGVAVAGCAGATNCSAVFPPIEIEATFELEPTFHVLNLTTSGTGSGSFSCDTGSGAEACEAEYEEGTEVTVTANPDTGSELGTISGTGSAAACAASPCTITMTEEGSIDAEFNLEIFTLTTEVIGEGGEVTAPGITCTEAGNGGPECEEDFAYGTNVAVAATPNSAEFVVATLTGGGDAAGTCTIAGGGASGECEFEIKQDSSVAAEFKLSAFKDTAEIETVHGEVPETTTLDGAGCEDVDLGKFIPGVDDNYDEECVVVLTSTGAETKFIASDESAEDTGHLVHEGGEYALEDALEVMAVDSQGNGSGPGLTALSPVTLLTFNDPIAKDTTTLTFNQHIGEEEGLLTGVYSKTILLTLEQTA